MGRKNYPLEVQALWQKDKTWRVFVKDASYHQGKKLTPHMPCLVVGWGRNALCPCSWRWGAAEVWVTGRAGGMQWSQHKSQWQGPAGQPEINPLGQGSLYRASGTKSDETGFTLSGWALQSTAIICFRGCIFGTHCTIRCCHPHNNFVISSFPSSVIVPVSKEQTRRIYSSGVG